MNLSKASSPALDRVPRYVPNTITTVVGRQRVGRVESFPPGAHPAGCPLVSTCTAVKVSGIEGRARWYGVEKAWINSELRMVVQGFPAGFEEMAAWKVCKQV